MKKRYPLCLTLALLSPPSFAQMCEVNPDSALSTDGISGYRVVDGSLILEACPDTLMLQDQAEICYMNDRKQWDCSTHDGEVQINNLLKSERYSGNFLDALIDMFSPGKDTSYGGKALKDQEYLAGFPYTEILLPFEPVQLDLGTAGLTQATGFKLVETGTGTELYSLDNPSGRIALPDSLFSPEGEYRWTMQADGETWTGVFSTTDQELQDEFEAELSELLPDADFSTDADRLMYALMARDYGFTFEYETLMRQLEARVAAR